MTAGTATAEPSYQQVQQALDAAAFAPPERSGTGEQKPPMNTCSVFVFSGAGTRSGTDLFLILADTLTPNKVSAARALEVSELSSRLRRQSAASVLILDTMFAGR